MKDHLSIQMSSHTVSVLSSTRNSIRLLGHCETILLLLLLYLKLVMVLLLLQLERLLLALKQELISLAVAPHHYDLRMLSHTTPHHFNLMLLLLLKLALLCLELL